RRPTVSLSALDGGQERDEGPNPEQEAARGQIRIILEAAIDDLPAAFRTVLMLRDVEDASVAQTAKVLGIKPETVRTRLHRARGMLRERLGEQFATALKDVFPFEVPRCNGLVQRILDRLEIRGLGVNAASAGATST